MSVTTQIPITKWARLYDAAQRFKTMACWEWMYDSDIFGVQNPRTRDIEYCCVMGNIGQFFALAVYPGSAGLDVLHAFRSGRIGPDIEETMFVQNCLMVSFGNREDLKARDHEVIKQLGLKFRGRHNWPLFRKYSPGYYPWYIGPEDVDFLTLALEQALEVAPRVKDNPDFLRPKKKGSHLVRISEQVEESLRWREQWLQPAPYSPEPEMPTLDGTQVKKAIGAIQRREGIWMGDIFYSPSLVLNGDPPYYPRTSLWVELSGKSILGFEMSAPHEGLQAHAAKFLSLVTWMQCCPKEVLVMRDQAVDFLIPLAEALNFEILLAERLPPLEQIKQALFQSFLR